MPGTSGRWDPEGAIDRAMSETFAEIEQQGSGVAPDDVVRAPAPRRGQSRTAVREDAPPPTAAPRRRSPDNVDAYSVLGDDPEDETRELPDDDDTDDEDDDLDDDDTDDEEDDDDLDDDVDAEEVEVEEDDDLGPEGDDDDEEEDNRPARADGRRKNKRDTKGKDTRKGGFSKKVERTIDQRVKAQVQRTLAENDTLRQRESERAKLDAENAQFLTGVLGTTEQLAALEATYLDRSLPQAQRESAATWLAGFKKNREFFERYKSGAWAVVRHQQAQEDLQVLQKVATLKALDPKVLGEGNRAKSLLHTYVTGMAVAKEIADKEIAKLRKQLANRKGSTAAHDVRRGITRRQPTAASSHGRRANGTVAEPDRLRGALVNERGIERGSSIPFPTDDLLRDLRNGEKTLASIGLAPTRRR